MTILEGFTKVTDCSSFVSTVKKVNADAFEVSETAINITLADGCDSKNANSGASSADSGASSASGNDTSGGNITAIVRRRQLTAAAVAANETAANETAAK